MTSALLILSFVLILCIMLTKVSSRLGMPMLLAFMILGMLFGSDGIFKIPFDDYDNKTVYQYYDFDGMSLIQSQISKFNNSAFTYLYFQTTQIRKNLENC